MPNPDESAETAMTARSKRKNTIFSFLSNYFRLQLFNFIYPTQRKRVEWFFC